MSKPRTTPIGRRNIVGTKIVQLRKARGMKQKDLVIRLQNMGMDISDTSMSRLEGQTRLVQDFEIFLNVFCVLYQIVKGQQNS